MKTYTKHGTERVAEIDALKSFRQIFKSVKTHYQWIEKKTGVNGAQIWALAVVVDQPGIKVKNLAEVLSIHQSTASNLVDLMVRAKYIRRERNENDQRIVHLFPEPAGKQLIDKAPKPLQGVLLDALRHLPNEELNQLSALLVTLIGKMKTKDETGGSTPLSGL